jgi:Tfp pilus assembly protein PilX
MKSRRTQSGATLIVALIMLVALALFAVSAFNTSNTDLKAAGNAQSRNEALYAAQQAIESTISSPQFIKTPADAVPNPCGAANTLCTDHTRDGQPEYVTRLEPAPRCIRTRTIQADQLNLTQQEELTCAAGQSQQFGVAGVDVSAGNSLCADSVWEITAQTRATSGGAAVTVTQGIGVRVAADEMAASCL